MVAILDVPVEHLPHQRRRATSYLVGSIPRAYPCHTHTRYLCLHLTLSQEVWTAKRESRPWEWKALYRCLRLRFADAQLTLLCLVHFH